MTNWNEVIKSIFPAAQSLLTLSHKQQKTASKEWFSFLNNYSKKKSIRHSCQNFKENPMSKISNPRLFPIFKTYFYTQKSIKPAHRKSAKPLCVI